MEAGSTALGSPATLKMSFDAVNFLLTMRIHLASGAGLDGATACREIRRKPMQTCYRRSR
jgi:hypothetical protein